jgi:hypothetical protein
MTDALSNAPEQSTRANTSATARRTKEGTTDKRQAAGKKAEANEGDTKGMHICIAHALRMPLPLPSLFLLVVRIALLS